MYAVIKTGGKQYRVSPGDKLRVELLEADEGSAVVFNEVLLVGEGADVQVGSPLVENAEVRGTSLGDGRGDKIIVYKFKRRKGYHKKQGHRQDYTLVQIDDVIGDVSALPEEEEEVKAEEAVEAEESAAAPNDEEAGVDESSDTEEE